MGAGLQHKVGKEWGLILWKDMANSSPSKSFNGTAKRSNKKAIKKRIEKQSTV